MGAEVTQRAFLKTLIAGSPVWQAWTGANTAAEAGAFVTWPDYAGQLLPFCVLVIHDTSHVRQPGAGVHTSVKASGGIQVLVYDRVAGEGNSDVYHEQLQAALDAQDFGAYQLLIETEDTRFGTLFTDLIDECITSERLQVSGQKINSVYKPPMPWRRTRLDVEANDETAAFTGPLWQAEATFQWGRQ